jgi:DNA-binding Lrp family transcriptional regulator
VVEKLKPMPGWLRRYAELADRGLSFDEIAEQLMVKLETIRKRYDPAYRNYISLAKEMVLELYNQGMDLEEAVARIKEELGLTKGMVDTALRLALEELGVREPKYERGLGEISKLRREGEEASRRVLEAAREAGVGGVEGDVDRDLIRRVRVYGGTIKALDDEINRIRLMIGARGWHIITATQPSYDVDAIISSISLIEAKIRELKRMFTEIEELVLRRCVKSSKRT